MSLRMATKSEEGETKEETYQNIVNVREEYAGKADLLLKEATGRDSATEEGLGQKEDW